MPRRSGADAGGPTARSDWRRRLGGGPTFVLATVWLLIVLIPLYYMVLATLPRPGSRPDDGTRGCHRATQPQQLQRPCSHAGLGRYFLNTAIVTVVSLVLILVGSLGRRVSRDAPATPASRNFMKLVVSGWRSRCRRSSCPSTSS